MSLTTRLLRIFYRTGAPALPVLLETEASDPPLTELDLVGWLPRKLLDILASDLDAIHAEYTEIPSDLLVSSLDENELRSLYEHPTLPALNLNGEEIGHLNREEFLLLLKRRPGASSETEASPDSASGKASTKTSGRRTSSSQDAKQIFGQLILGSIPYPLYAADLKGSTLFFNRLFENQVLTRPTLGQSIRKAEPFFRELVIELLAHASEEGISTEFQIYEDRLDLEIRMCTIESGGEVQGYLFVFENPSFSSETAAWRKRLLREHDFEKLVDDFEARLIADSLRRNGQNISHTAEDLGIKRSTLQSKIKRLRIEERFPVPEEVAHAPIRRRRKAKKAQKKTLPNPPQKTTKKTSASAPPAKASKKTTRKTNKKSKKTLSKKSATKTSPASKRPSKKKTAPARKAATKKQKSKNKKQ